jgi:Leucine-rich repeat (LRR) protein
MAKNTLTELCELFISGATILTFTNLNIDNDGALKISRYLDKAEKLTQLGLDHNQIGDIGIIAISVKLKKHCTDLTHLSLYGNPITDEGFSVLFENLKGSKIIHLDLRMTKISKTGLIMLAELKKSRPVLTYYLSVPSLDVLE